MIGSECHMQREKNVQVPNLHLGKKRKIGDYLLNSFLEGHGIQTIDSSDDFINNWLKKSKKKSGEMDDRDSIKRWVINSSYDLYFSVSLHMKFC